jgi:hypothetical protein
VLASGWRRQGHILFDFQVSPGESLLVRMAVRVLQMPHQQGRSAGQQASGRSAASPDTDKRHLGVNHIGGAAGCSPLVALDLGIFEVVVAAHAAAAYHVLDRKIEQLFRVVITDINLGVGPDGRAVARHARELDSAVPVIYVTGAHGRDWQSKAVPNSIMIAKPFTGVQLVDTVSALLAVRRAASNPFAV